MVRDKLVQLLVLGVTAGGVGAGFIALINTGFKSEDVFAFAGAVVGAAATVAGAAWLADRALTRERREEQSLIREELQALHQVASAAAASNPKVGDWTDEWRSSMNAMIDVARGSCRFLDEVIATARTLDFHQREAVKLTREAAARFVSFHNDVFSERELEHWDERTWASEIEPVVSETSAALRYFRKH
jgi:type II secretory pathway pseudopilin PulG